MSDIYSNIPNVFLFGANYMINALNYPFSALKSGQLNAAQFKYELLAYVGKLNHEQAFNKANQQLDMLRKDGTLSATDYLNLQDIILGKSQDETKFFHQTPLTQAISGSSYVLPNVLPNVPPTPLPIEIPSASLEPEEKKTLETGQKKMQAEEATKKEALKVQTESKKVLENTLHYNKPQQEAKTKQDAKKESKQDFKESAILKNAQRSNAFKSQKPFSTPTQKSYQDWRIISGVFVIFLLIAAQFSYTYFQKNHNEIEPLKIMEATLNNITDKITDKIIVNEKAMQPSIMPSETSEDLKPTEIISKVTPNITAPPVENLPMETLLIKVQESIALNKIEPKETQDSAWFFFNQMIKQDTLHPLTRSARIEIAKAYLGLSQIARENNDWDKAEYYSDQAILVRNPDIINP